MRAAALAAAVLACGCGGMPADEQILVRFFERSRVYDRTMLAEVATVAFDPRVDGLVDRFEIVARRVDAAPDGRARQTVTVRATVRSPAGSMSVRTLAVAMEERRGSWIVTGFR